LSATWRAFTGMPDRLGIPRISQTTCVIVIVIVIIVVIVTIPWGAIRYTGHIEIGNSNTGTVFLESAPHLVFFLSTI
jgi:hypothetical protein